MKRIDRSKRRDTQGAAPVGSSRMQRMKAAATVAAMVGGVALGAAADPSSASRGSLADRVAAVRQALERKLEGASGVEQREIDLPYPAAELAQWGNWGNWGNWNNWNNWKDWANAWTNWVNV
jgi:hypothetical protein